MESNEQQAVRRPTPFQLFVRELKTKKVEMTSTVLALLCVIVSSKLVSLKNERKAVDSEHEERMANLMEDNRVLREKLGDLRDRVMEEVNKQQRSRRIDPLSTRIDAIFEELKLVPPAETSPTSQQESNKPSGTSGKFFV